jgi:hypothetical protein
MVPPTLTTKTRFAVDVGVSRQLLLRAWSRSDHPEPVHTTGSAEFYRVEEMKDWWTAYLARPREDNPDEHGRYQVNSRFTRDERHRMAAVSRPGETFSSVFRRMALLGLQVAEAQKNRPGSLFA